MADNGNTLQERDRCLKWTLPRGEGNWSTVEAPQRRGSVGATGNRGNVNGKWNTSHKYTKKVRRT